VSKASTGVGDGPPLPLGCADILLLCCMQLADSSRPGTLCHSEPRVREGLCYSQCARQKKGPAGILCLSKAYGSGEVCRRPDDAIDVCRCTCTAHFLPEPDRLEGFIRRLCMCIAQAFCDRQDSSSFSLSQCEQQLLFYHHHHQVLFAEPFQQWFEVSLS